MQGSLKKVVQKQAYDILSHRYGILIVLAAIVIITVSAFHFGEAVLEWSHEKYAVVFNSYSDNLAGRSFRERLCLPVPIDIVYTWVNGTDPLLLNQLRHFKHSMESELNVSRSVTRDEKGEEKCVFPNCLTTNMVILDPSLPPDMTLTKLSEEYPVFTKATSMKEVSSHLDDKIRYTVIYFSSDDEVKESLSTHLMINQLNTTIKRGFITSDWTIHNSILMSDIIMMSGFPYKLTEEDIKQKLQEKYTRGIDKVELYSEKGVAVLHMSDKEVINQILTVGNITIDGKEPTFNAANLVWDLRDFSRDDDISASRFEDNEELRYSLRSVEKFAPWVRHVYIITNGQIPHWLNLESPRVTIVTHSDLFLNKSHLPTFSSPAIESHIHRIPGLSQKFIYMNDDVMFGTEVWPDDFYSHSTGQKVYLTWPVPNCNEGCPSSWIKDGYCDKACNNTECEWDGGDCSGDNSRPGVGNWGSAGLYAVSEQQYCNKGCANSWLADRYCDTSCNVPACGFDVGDCGTSNYNKLHQLDLLKNTTHYTLPPGEIMGYFNLSSLLRDKGSVNSASYRKSDVIRVATVAQKFKVMTFILYPGHNATVLTFQLKYHLQNVSNMLTINFTLNVDTKLKKLENTTADTVVVDKKNKTLINNTQDLAETYVVYDVPEDKQFPHIKSSDYGIVEPLPANINMSTYTLPQHLNEEFNSLLQELHDGELTEKGFNIRQTLLWKKYKEFLVSGGKVQRNTTAKILTGQSDGHKSVESQGHQEQRLGNRKLLEYINIPVLEIERKKTKNMFNHMSGIQERTNKSDLIQEAEFAELLKKSSHLFPEGHFPWERNGNIFTQIIKAKDKQEKEAKYKTSPQKVRKLLDTFGDSLRHVNRIYNKAFGYSARKVPGHMPHMIDKLIMQELQDRFPKEWEVTSSNKMRSSNDMQFAFSYFYYLMGVTKNVSAADVFDEMDTDSSRVLSDREIRTLATRLYDLPLDLQTLTGLERILMNCSEHLTQEEQAEYPPPPVEHYYDQGMPQITRNLFIKCPGMINLVSSNFKPRQVYRHVEIDDAEIAFKMLKGNISTVVGQLDDVRKHPKKFICLNDNIDHNKDEAKTVKAILQDFYESVFPTPSQFELPRDYRNRFLHTDELREWKRYRDWLKFWTHLALAVLIIFTVASFFAEKIEALQKRYRRRMRSSSEKSNKEQDKDATSSSSRTKDGAVMTV